MELKELPGLITKHVSMLKAAAGETLDNPGFKQMVDRQGVYNATKDKRAEIYDQVTGSERPLLEQMTSVADASQYAVSRQHELFGDSGDSGGEGDTFRHMALSATLQREQPKHAQDYGDIHELQGWLSGQPIQEESRDQGNNRLGRKIGEFTRNRQEDETMIRAVMPRSTPNVQSWGPQKLMEQRQAIWGK